MFLESSLSMSNQLSNVSLLTAKEYLTRHHILVDQEQVQEFVTSHLDDIDLHDTLLLLSRLVSTPDKILSQIEDASRKYINTPRLRALLSWIEFIVSDDLNSHDSLAERVFASLIALTSMEDCVSARVILLLHALALFNDVGLSGRLHFVQVQARTLASNFSLDTVDLAYQLTCQLEALGIFRRVNLTCLSADIATLMPTVRGNTISEAESELLWHLWLDAFQLEPEFLSLSQVEIENFKRYLDSNLLLLQCKKASLPFQIV